MLKRLLHLTLLAAALAAPTATLAQTAVLQGGPWVAGHAPIYNRSGGAQAVVIDSGPAGSNTTGQGLSELNVTARGSGTAPYAGQGTGPNGEIMCLQDAVSTNATGYHYLCFSANAQSGGLLSYGAGGAASTLPFNFIVNGTTYAFPFAVGGIIGPGTTVVNDPLCWNNTAGTLVKTCTGAAPLTIGGTNGQIQYNNAGALGGFTVSGDGTLVSSTGVLTISKIGNVSVVLGGTLTTSNAFTTAGAFPITLTAVGSTSVTLPQTGTLATLAGSEALTNKSINGLTITSSTGTLTVTNAKTLTASNTLTFSGTDGSTLNIGTGGTLASAAFTASTAYVPSNTQITNSIGSDVALNNVSNYFTGPTVAQGSTGTWFASGSVSVGGLSGDNINCKLWDGTTVMASGRAAINGGTWIVVLALSGYITSPAGNIRISCNDSSSTSGIMVFNATGNSKDSTITAFRVN